ncbi:MAG: InlB B-repeat-containing protein [Bacilli bacterium]|nr:InlB B-repeat-containing protein [Bacilli bacterium]
MKKNLLKKLCLGMAGSLVALSLVSCSMFFEGETGGGTVSEITKVTDSTTGDVIVTIYFTDESKEPIVVTIPSKISGSEGVGIANIISETSDNFVTITIVYTDSNKTPTVITVPINQPEDGKGVKDVEFSTDDDGNVTFKFVYTDGSESDEIKMPSGKDGVGIKSFTLHSYENGVYIYKVEFTDGDVQYLQLKDGKGVASVMFDSALSTETEYALSITYDDGTVETIMLPKPLTNKWYCGNGAPDSTTGMNGDYYLDRVTGGVYFKENNAWSYLFSMKGSGSSESMSYTVAFNANGGEYVNSSSVNLSDTRSYLVSKGNYVNLSGDDLLIAKAGYKFEGWWTCPDHTVDPNAGHFTNLTPVMGNLTLYANWSAI